MIEQIPTFLISTLKKINPEIFWALTIGIGFILFGSDTFVTTLGLAELRTQGHGYLGAIFVLSVSIVLVQTILTGWRCFLNLIAKRKEKKDQAEALKKNQETLHNLTPDEKAYLKPYILDNTNTQYFQNNDGVAG